MTFCAKLIAGVGLSLTLGPSPARAQDTPPLDLRAVFEFSSPIAQQWNLRLRLTDVADPHGSLREIRNFSQHATTTGIFYLDAAGRELTIRTRHAISGGKLEIRIRGSRGAKLWVEPLDSKDVSPHRFQPREIALTELLPAGPIASAPIPTATTNDPVDVESWTLVRAPGDGLRLDQLSDVPVYRPGESIQCGIRANHEVRFASGAYSLSYELLRTSDGTVVQSRRWPIHLDANGNSSELELREAVPDVPGVYEMRVQLEADDEKLWSRLRRRQPPLVRLAKPLAVIAAVQATRVEATPWREIGTIRPSESTWSMGQWLPKAPARLIPGSHAPPLPNLQTETHAGKAVSVIPPQESFQATLPVETPGLPHKITLHLPATGLSDLQIQLGGSREHATTSFLLEGDTSADQRGPWRAHTFIHYPVAGDQIWLTNLDAADSVSIESIIVEAGPLRVAPLADPLDQQATPSSSLAASRAAVLGLLSTDWMATLSGDITHNTTLTDCDPATQELYRLWVASERIRDYAACGGFNGIMIPANHGARAWYESSIFSPQIDRSSFQLRQLKTLLSLLETSDLQIHVLAKPVMLLSGIERAIEAQQGSLAELTRGELRETAPAASDGVTTREATRTQYNPLHPLVQQAISEMVREVNDQCAGYRGYAGLIIDCEGSSHLQSGHLATDAGSVRMFARTNKGPSDPAELREWIRQQGRERLEAWAASELLVAYQRVSQVADSVAARLLTSAVPNDESADGPKLVRPFTLGPAGLLSKQSRLTQQIASVAAPMSSILIGEDRVAKNIAIVIREQWTSDLSRLLDRTDPRLVIVDHRLVACHFSDNLQHTLKAFCALPDLAMHESQPVDSASHTVHLRSGLRDGYTYVAMINVVPWDCDVDLEMSAPTQWQVLGRSETPGQTLVQSSSGTRARITVPTGQMVVVRSVEPSASTVRSWTTRVSGGPEAIESIKHKITLIVERIGILSDFKPSPGLNNGGFEQAGDMGIVGWLHAQHPPGCVQLEDKEFTEGAHSVMLTTSAHASTRTWLVSETIPVPKSGRLAVSLACRGEAKADEPAHQIRISIEATRHGEPVRFGRDLEVPRDGKWVPRDVVLEVDELDDSSIASLRLTIDSLSAGRVWIDDVQLHDHFPTSQERADLQSQAFLAVQGLQRGNLLPSGKLLQHDWARYLLTLGPSEQTKRVIESLPVSSDPPGVAERIRNWLPHPLRF